MVISNIIRVPEKKYIQTLIAGKNNAALIIDELQMRKIPVPTNEMKEIYTEVIRSCPDPTYFNNDSKAAPTEEWLEELQVIPMYYYRFNKATDRSLLGCEGAFKMLEDPKMVRFIHTLAVAGVNKDDIELILNAKYNISYETPDFDIFMHYFANYTGWSYTEKEMYVNQVQDLELKKLFRSALVQDRSTLIWELGLGTDPNASFDDMLKDMFTDAYFYFKRNAKYKTEDAMRFATLATKISDRMDQIKDKNAEHQDLFSELKIKLQHEDTTDKKSQVVKDASEMDIEIPERTEQRIQNLEALMTPEDANAIKT